VSALTAADVRVVLGGSAAPIVDGVSLRVESGGWLGVIGPNGAGKSTLLKAIAGLLPYQGTVTLDPEPAGRTRRDLARLVAYVAQQPVLPPDITVHEYVMLGRTPYLGYLGNPGRRDREIAEAAVDRLELAGLAQRRLGTLSGGERQRVTLARALAQQPRVLLLDEPTQGLSVEETEQAVDTLARFLQTSRMTVLLVEHDMEVVFRLAHRITVLHRGTVIADGAPDQVKADPAVQDAYLGGFA
jgi:iron complex transport system ATP-binding protein